MRSRGLCGSHRGRLFQDRETQGPLPRRGPLNLLSPESLLKEYDGAWGMGLATLTYGPLAQELLTGEYPAESVFDQTDRRHHVKHFPPDAFRANRHVLEALKAISGDVGRSPAEVAIRWVIDCGVASSVIVGTKTPAQVLENWGAQSWSLSRPHLEKLKIARCLAGFG